MSVETQLGGNCVDEIFHFSFRYGFVNYANNIQPLLTPHYNPETIFMATLERDLGGWDQ